MKYIARMGIKVPTLEGARTDVAKAHWFIEYLLKTLTDLIKKHNKDPNRDLTDDELQELLNPGRVIKFKKEKKMTTKIPNNVMKPPKGFEYVTEEKRYLSYKSKELRVMMRE